MEELLHHQTSFMVTTALTKGISATIWNHDLVTIQLFNITEKTMLPYYLMLKISSI